MIPMMKRQPDEVAYSPMRPEAEGEDARMAAIAKMREQYSGDPSAVAPTRQMQQPVTLQALMRRRQGQGPGGIAALLQSLGGQGAGGQPVPSPTRYGG